MKSKRKSENTSRQMKVKTQPPKSVVHSKSSSQREVYNNRGLHQETRKISNKQSNIPSKGVRKRRTKS